MRLVADLSYVGDPVGLEANLSISVLRCLAEDTHSPEDRQRVQRMLFESPDGEQMLAALESKLGLALIPVELV